MRGEKSTERKFKNLQWLLHESIEVYGPGHQHTIYLSQELDKVVVEMQREIHYNRRNNEMVFDVITNLKHTYPDRWRKILHSAEDNIRKNRSVKNKCTSSKEGIC